MGGVGLLQLARPQPQEAQPVNGHRRPGGQQLHRGQVVAGERPGGPPQGEHPDGPALDHHRAPGLGVAGAGDQGPADELPAGWGHGVGGQGAVASPGTQASAGPGHAPGRPGHEAVLREQDHALGRLGGPAGALQQGGAGRGQVLAARQDPERGQQLLADARSLRSGHVLSSSCSSGSRN